MFRQALRRRSWNNREIPALAQAVAHDFLNSRIGSSFRWKIRAESITVSLTLTCRLPCAVRSVQRVRLRGDQPSSSVLGVLCVYYDRDRLMKAWRKAVIALLRAALRAGQFRTEMIVGQTEELSEQEKRWWIVNIRSFEDKWHFLQYAGRYVRRPPIAQRRITWVVHRTVRFWYKDKKLRRRVYVQCSLEEFINRWAQHIPEFYQHAVRSFGQFAPRALSQTSAAIFAILGQERKPRPKPRCWADSIKRDFGRDPLLDHAGKRMKWSRRIRAKATP
jgi:hypothetical protein